MAKCGTWDALALRFPYLCGTPDSLLIPAVGEIRWAWMRRRLGGVTFWNRADLLLGPTASGATRGLPGRRSDVIERGSRSGDPIDVGAIQHRSGLQTALRGSPSPGTPSPGCPFRYFVPRGLAGKRHRMAVNVSTLGSTAVPIGGSAANRSWAQRASEPVWLRNGRVHSFRRDVSHWVCYRVAQLLGVGVSISWFSSFSPRGVTRTCPTVTRRYLLCEPTGLRR